MTNLNIEEDKLVIEIEGMDKVWSLKSHITIPLKHISEVKYDPQEAEGWWHGLKLPGSRIPGVIEAGTFLQGGVFVFRDVHHPEKTIVINLHDETYKKLVIEVEDPEAAVKEITAKIANVQ